jgi:hypothetical protein
MCVGTIDTVTKTSLRGITGLTKMVQTVDVWLKTPDTEMSVFSRTHTHPQMSRWKACDPKVAQNNKSERSNHGSALMTVDVMSRCQPDAACWKDCLKSKRR